MWERGFSDLTSSTTDDSIGLFFSQTRIKRQYHNMHTHMHTSKQKLGVKVLSALYFGRTLDQIIILLLQLWAFVTMRFV